MPKKFQDENTKAVAARARKADAKAEEQEKKAREKEDAQWRDDDKHAQKKMQRKNDQEQRRLQELERKTANKQAYEQEMTALAESSAKSAKSAAPPKVTRAHIERERQLEEVRRKEEERARLLEQKKIVVQEEESEELPENVNRLQIEGHVARTVDEAITVLKVVDGAASTQDKHPEKRLKAAFTAFEERRVPELKQEHPTLRLSQLRQLVKKEWQKSPENPLNQKIMNIIQ